MSATERAHRIDPRLTIRPAADSDRSLLFEWANDPATRAQSFSSTRIPWNDHVAWLASVLNSPVRRLYIVSIASAGGGGEEPVAQTRFDVQSVELAELSVTVAPSWRGHGLAAPVLRLATAHFVGDTGIRRVRARVKSGNEASRRAFLRAGFVEVSCADSTPAVVCLDFDSRQAASV